MTETKPISERTAKLVDRHPLLQALLDGEFRGQRFIDDMHAALRRGSMTTKQISGAERYIVAARKRAEMETVWAAERQTLTGAGVTCPTGKVTFTGQITTVTYKSNRFGGGAHKMLVVSDEGWKAWGTLPAAMLPSSYTIDSLEAAREKIRGMRVTVTATVNPSDDDPIFGFMARPKVTAAT